MTTLQRSIAALAAVLLAIATGLGAAASHGLADRLPAAAMQSIETGVAYQFYHSLGLLALALATRHRRPTGLLQIALIAIATGTVLFCGGVYAAAFDIDGVAQFAPAGGILLIGGWLATAAALLARGPVD